MSRTKDNKTNKNQNTSQEQTKEQEMTFPYYDWINGSYYRNKKEYDVHAPDHIPWEEVSQKTLNEVNKKYNLGYKVDKNGNVVRNKYTHTPIYADVRKYFPKGEEYDKLYENYVKTNKRSLELEKTAKIKTKPSSTVDPGGVKIAGIIQQVGATTPNNKPQAVAQRNAQAKQRQVQQQTENKDYIENQKKLGELFLNSAALVTSIAAMGSQIGSAVYSNKANDLLFRQGYAAGINNPKYINYTNIADDLDRIYKVAEAINLPIDIAQFVTSSGPKEQVYNGIQLGLSGMKYVPINNPAFGVVKPATSFLGNLMELISLGFKEGSPLKKLYKDFSTRLSKAWGNQDLSQDNYDYQKYYNDDPDRAYRQLESIEKGGQGHFDDEGKSGTYKTPNHATYPDLGANSWLDNGRIFNISARDNIRDEIDTDRILDYFGHNLNYNNGATKVIYNGAYLLPSATVVSNPKGNDARTELIPNELGTGWMYRDRAGRFANFNYDYVNRYDGNQKALSGNLFRNGSWMPNKQWRNRISAWEGSSMYRPAPDTGRVNSSFQAEASRFLSVLPKKALQKLPEQAINALYSYSYNVGAGNFKKRVVPVLNKYLDGKASLQQVTNSMYATKDSQLRGLQKRRRYERGAFEAAITGKDLTGTNAYQQYDPLTSNYQSSNSPATKRRNIQWTDTINLNDGSLIQPNQQAPSLMQQLAHSEEILAEANKRINQVTTRMMPDAQSNDPYINAVYNSSIQDNRELLANDLKTYLETSLNY
jgi:hypothetical protein